jgi:uncharacterized protein
MKLHLNIERELPLSTGFYGEDHVLIDDTRHDQSLLLIGSQTQPAPWAGLKFEAFTEAHFRWIAEHPVEIVLFGSGHKLRSAHPSLTRSLAEARIGLEVMDIGAMCRTYNILVGEGMSVADAMLIQAACVVGRVWGVTKTMFSSGRPALLAYKASQADLGSTCRLLLDVVSFMTPYRHAPNQPQSH